MAWGTVVATFNSLGIEKLDEPVDVNVSSEIYSLKVWSSGNCSVEGAPTTVGELLSYSNRSWSIRCERVSTLGDLWLKR